MAFLRIIENRKTIHELPDDQQPKRTQRISDGLKNHLTATEEVELERLIRELDFHESERRHKTDEVLSRMGHEDLKNLYRRAEEFMRLRPYQAREAYEQDITGYGIEKWREVESQTFPLRAKDYLYFTGYPLKYSPYDHGYIAADYRERVSSLEGCSNMTGVLGYMADGSCHNIEWSPKFKEWIISPSDRKMETYTANRFDQWHETDFQLLADKIAYCRSDVFKQSTFEEKMDGLTALLKELDYTGVYPNREIFPVYRDYVAELAKESGINLKWDQINDNELNVSRQKYLTEMAIDRQSDRLSQLEPQYRLGKVSEQTALQRILQSRENLEKAYPRISLEKIILSASNRLNNDLTKIENQRKSINIKM